jgi:proteic killer suppression protein
VLSDASFKDAETQRIWPRLAVRKFGPAVQRIAWRKLAYLNAAEEIGDLAVPPGNKLEKLKGDRAGQYSIRVNDQYRICFKWAKTGPAEIALVDDH